MAQASPGQGKAYIITGPTSGIGYRTALELARHGTVVLVGRNREKLGKGRESIARAGGHAVPVVGDLSDLASVRTRHRGLSSRSEVAASARETDFTLL
jgi:NAD(P)-dependent dehydrogenase (short-subunit alcohol dehydrogenase family)